jgi:hypothetical protein
VHHKSDSLDTNAARNYNGSYFAITLDTCHMDYLVTVWTQ